MGVGVGVGKLILLDNSFSILASRYSYGRRFNYSRVGSSGGGELIKGSPPSGESRSIALKKSPTA